VFRCITWASEVHLTLNVRDNHADIRVVTNTGEWRSTKLKMQAVSEPRTMTRTVLNAEDAMPRAKAAHGKCTRKDRSDAMAD